MEAPALTRRALLIASAAAGGGLAIGFMPASNAETRPPAEVTPWLTIGADDTVTVRVTTPEVGNGITTQAALIVAEELGCDWRSVRTEYASPARDVTEKTGYGGKGGPLAWFSGRSMEPDRIALMQRAGAAARERLRQAAAGRWAVPPGEVAIADGGLRHAPTGRTLRFGEVAAEAARVVLPAEPAPKPPAEWMLLGKATPAKIGIDDVLHGRPTYGIDVRLPGMVYAALRQAPVHGGRLKSFDAKAVRNLPGVLAVVAIDPGDRSTTGGAEPMGGMPVSNAAQAAVAVIAEHYWQARMALDRLPVEWEAGPGARWTDNDRMRAAALAALDTPATPVHEHGDVASATGKRVEAVYHTPYCDQAPIEPLNATALVTADSVELWCPGQQSAQGLWIAANEARMPIERAVFHQTRVGGAFGRRIFGDEARMAVAVARQFPGRPVQLIWSREEMMRQGRYRPLVTARLAATLDGDGRPATLVADAAQAKGFPTIGLSDSPYLKAIGGARISLRTLDFHLLTGSFRGPSYNSYNFILESFIDECAAAAGADPLAYRLALLEGWPDAGWRRCLTLAAERAGWGTPLAKGSGRGIAIGNWGGYGRPQAGTTVAAVAQVAVSPDGTLSVPRIDLAVDCGRFLNPRTVEQQISGGALFGLSVAWNEGLSVQDGAIVEGNFDAYPVLRIGDAPRVHVHLDACTGHERFGEIGEVAVAPTAAAVANAIFAATGKRLREQPFRSHDLSWS